MIRSSQKSSKCPRCTALASAGALLWGLASCDGKPSVSSSTSEVTVKGSVTLFGKKATRGQVVFDPSNYLRPNEATRSAPIGEDGSFEIKTLTGTNFVSIQTPEVMRTRDEPPQIEVNVQSEGQVIDLVYPPQ